MGKASYCDKNGLKKGPWTAEEDQKLIEFIQKHGNRKWRTVSKESGLRRCGKSCRLRWTNYLKPGIKRGKFSLEEEETIIQLHSVLGNKWSTIAARLPGRTDNEIKNFWNTHVKKRLLRMGIDPVTHAPRMDLLEIASMLSSSLYNPTQQQNYNSLGFGPAVVNQNLLNLITSFIISSPPEHKNTPQDLHQESNQILNIQDSLMMRSLWQNNNGELYNNVGDEYCFVSTSNVACENGNIQCLMMNPEAQNQTGVVSSNNDQFLLSSTPTLSSSMYVSTGTTEDEMDSYSCSSMLMFDHIPNSSGFGSFQ